MHILFLTDNFPPEGNAPATRTFEHAKVWVELGHKVTVVTTVPNFPTGKVFGGYKNCWFQKEFMEGIEVRRVKTYIAANTGFGRRIVDYLSFMITGTFACFFIKKVDVVVATSPQFFTALGGYIVSGIRRKPFVFELRDLWPASITAVGAMNKTLFIRLLEKIEMFLYQRAKKIISVTNSFKKELVERGINADKISIVLNGVDLKIYSPQKKDPILEERWGLKNKFVVGYVGTHGMAHGLKYVLEAAEILKEHEDICFLFAGGGSALEEIRHERARLKLKNVKILGIQQKEIMPKIWGLCDVSLVHLTNTPLFESVIPSKIFESMGMGLPILISMPEGEATKIVRDSQAGVVVTPEQPGLLAQKVEFLKRENVICEGYATASYKSARLFERRQMAIKMLKTLEQVI